MKKSFATVFIFICLISMLSGCTNSHKISPSSNDISQQKSQNVFYGDLTLPGDLFSVFAVYNNSLLYLSLNESNQAGIRRFDMNSGASVEICRLEDYLMNPANNTVLDGILYFNYTTKDAARKMIAIDMIHDTEEIIVTDHDVQGMVYSAATSGKVFSLKHTNNGTSVIECYSPGNGTTIEFLSVGNGQIIHAISVYEERLYALMQDETRNYYIAQYDASRNVIGTWDIAFVTSILQDSQVGYFQIMNEAFYLSNFSGKSSVFQFDGTVFPDLQGWSIATDTVGSYSQYVFFNRGSDFDIYCYDTNENKLSDIQLDIKEENVIRYIYSDCNDSQRILISIKNAKTEKEYVTVVKSAK